MARRIFGFFSALLLPLLAVSVQASTVQVGHCLSGQTSYSSITAVIAAVQPGSTINVCPGTYYEQLTISKSLTLQGAVTSSTGFTQIFPPTTDLARNISSPNYGAIAAEIGITAGTVNLKNLTVWDYNSTLGCVGGNSSAFVVGVYYLQASGTISHVDTYGQTPGGCGVGIFAESTLSPQTLTVENSSVANFDLIGITTSSFSPGRLSATIKGNFLQTGTTPQTTTSKTVGIAPGGGAVATISQNVIQVQSIGIKTTSKSAAITANTISGSSDGIDVYNGPANIVGNFLFDVSNGITLNSSGGTVKGNHMSNLSTGILNGCNQNALTLNVIDTAGLGIMSPDPSLTTGNTFFNTFEAQQACQ